MKTEDLELFVRTADCGSISGAARQLSLSVAAASAALKRLEDQLSTTLFIRSTRQLRMTPEGERFLSYCRDSLHRLNEGLDVLRAEHDKYVGDLRISVSSDLGRNLIAGWLDEVMEAHPQLTLNLVLGDAVSDFYKDRVDIAIRYGKQEDSTMVAFPLAKNERILCAAPSYIAKFGEPTSLDQLATHNCLLFTLNNRLYDTWELLSPAEQCNAKKVKVKVSGNRSSNDADIVRRWAVAGKGIAYKSRLDMAADLASGRVVEILPKVESEAAELNLVVPSRRQVTPVVLYIRDVLREKIRVHLTQGS